MADNPTTISADLAQIVEQIRDWLSRQGIVVAIVFGSVARDTAKRDSDFDIAVRAADAKPLSPAQTKTLIEGLAERTGRPIDLIDLATVGEPLLGQILQSGRLLLGTTADHAELISRHLFDEADFMPYRRRILEHRRRQWLGK